MTALLAYQLLFAVSIITNVAIALVHVVAPERFGRFVGLQWQEPMRGYSRAWGMTLLWIHVAYIPGLLDPIGTQWPNWVSIGIKLAMPFVFFTNERGFRLFGIWDLGFGLALAVAYLNLFAGEWITVGIF
jgi:hypothetical protein